MNHLSRNDLIDLYEYIREASEILGANEELILQNLDISDEAWQSTLKRLDKEIEEMPETEEEDEL